MNKAIEANGSTRQVALLKALGQRKFLTQRLVNST